MWPAALAHGCFTDQETQEKCLACDAGTYTDQQGMTVCADCAAGRYSVKRAKECYDCLPGSYRQLAMGPELYLDQDCPKGTTQANEGQMTCLECVNGTFAQDAGQTGCLFPFRAHVYQIRFQT